MDINDVPMIVNWFANPTAVARGMGLDIELPDPDVEDPLYLEEVHRRDWRLALVGKIDMTAEEIARWDPDWVRLKRFGGTIEAWFDLEEGIVFRCRAGEIGEVTSLIRKLSRECGLRVRRWSSGQPDVVVKQNMMGEGSPSGKELAPCLEPAGFEGGCSGRWVLRLTA